jgi:hypothetical protein
MEDFFKIDGDQLGRTANFNLRIPFHRSEKKLEIY